MNTNPVLNTIHHRRSVRHYLSDRPVDKTTLLELVRAGMAAPSACNCQPWDFIVIDDDAEAAKLAALHPYATYLNTARRAVLVCGTPRRSIAGLEEYWIQDCAAATENILLAADALGLGSVWCGVYPNQPVVRAISEELHLPAGTIPLNLIVIGYPDGSDPAQQKFSEARVHWNQWK